MLERLGINAKEAEKTLMVASSEKKNQALKKIAEGLIENTDKIIEANKVLQLFLRQDRMLLLTQQPFV